MNVWGANVIALASTLAFLNCCVDKNFNLGHTFQAIKDKAFIFHMYISYDKTFHMVPSFFILPCDLDLEVWPTFEKHFNLGHNFHTRSDRAFILHMCIPCDKTFHMVPQFLCPPLKKEGHIVLHVRSVCRSVGMSVALNLVQLITPEGFAPEASNLVGR